MAETLSMLSVICFVIAGACFVLAVFFWIFFKIPSVFGDLTGRTAKKSIAKMRETNEHTGNKTYKTSKTNSERGKLTDTMRGIRKTKDQRPETGLLMENQAELEEIDDIATAPLRDVQETVPLDMDTVKLVDSNETAPLGGMAGNKKRRVGSKKLVMKEEVMMIHTNEVIE